MRVYNSTKAMRLGRTANLALLVFIAFGLLGAATQPILAASATHEGRLQARESVAHLAPSVYALPRLVSTSPDSLPSLPHQTPGSFPFHTASSPNGRIVVHFYHDSTAFAEQFIALAEQDLLHPIYDTLGFTLKHPVNIYLYATRADFLKGAPVSDAAETYALTDPWDDTVYLVSNSAADEGATDDLPHELTHVVFHENEDAGHLENVVFSFFPLWLDEGLATYDEPSTATQVYDYQGALADVIHSGHLVDLLSVFNNNYPTDPNVDFNAYAESRSFITYLISTYGATTFHHFLAAIKYGNISLAAESIFGASLPILEFRWETSIGFTVSGHLLGYDPVTIPPTTPQSILMPGAASLATPYAVRWNPDLPLWVGLALLALLLLALIVTGAARSQWRNAQEALRYQSEFNARINSSPVQKFFEVPPDYILPTVPASYAAEIAAAKAADQVAVARAAVAPPKPRQFAHPHVAEPWLIIASVILAAIAGYLAVRLDPTSTWQRGYVVALLVVMLFALAELLLTLRDGLISQPRIPLFRLVSLLFILALLAVLGQQCWAAPGNQAQQYEQHGSYRLALRYFAAENGAAAGRATDLERVHIEWAQLAIPRGHYSIAQTQLQAALALAPSATTANASALAMVVTSLGSALLAAGNYPQAVQVYNEQQHSSRCDSSCRRQMAQDASAAYLAWANALFLTGNYSAVLSTLHIITASFAGTFQASTAANAVPEVAALQLLEKALQAGGQGKYSSMNHQLRALAAEYPHTAAGSVEAAQTPEPVSGAVVDAGGFSVTGDLLFFLAFRDATQAETFQYDFAKDPSDFKVATRLGPGGAFTVRLQPGYWYVPVWDDPSLAYNSYFNSPESSTNAAFTVHPYTPENVGVIVGF